MTRARLFGLLASALACLVTLAVAEVAMRTLQPSPRVQILRPGNYHLQEIDGQPFWKMRGNYAEALRNDDCVGDVHILLAADSILYVLGPSDDGTPAPDDAARHAVGTKLQALLSRPDRTVCVRNVSVPAYGPQQQHTATERALADHPADLVVFGVWKPDNRFTRVGDAWYPFTQYETDAAGFPVLTAFRWSLPTALHRALVPRSTTYEYTLLTAGLPDQDAYAITAYEDLMDWAREADQPLLMVEFPRMSVPFNEQLLPGERQQRARVQAEAEERDVPYLLMAEHFVGRTPEELRTDHCCHHSAQGHEAMAEVLAERIRGMIITKNPPTPEAADASPPHPR